MILHNVFFSPLCTPPPKFCPVWLTVLFITSARGLHGQFSSDMTNTNTPNPTPIESLHPVERTFFLSLPRWLFLQWNKVRSTASPSIFHSRHGILHIGLPCLRPSPITPCSFPTSSDQPFLAVGPCSTSIRWEHEGSLFGPARLQEACVYWTWTRPMGERILISLLNACQLSL